MPDRPTSSSRSGSRRGVPETPRGDKEFVSIEMNPPFDANMTARLALASPRDVDLGSPRDPTASPTNIELLQQTPHVVTSDETPRMTGGTPPAGLEGAAVGDGTISPAARDSSPPAQSPRERRRLNALRPVMPGKAASIVPSWSNEPQETA